MSNLRITNRTNKTIIEEKRFYPPFELKADCPKCGATVDRNSDEYLSYPCVNAPENVHFYHEAQDAEGKWEEHEWTEQIILRVTAEPA